MLFCRKRLATPVTCLLGHVTVLFASALDVHTVLVDSVKQIPLPWIHTPYAGVLKGLQMSVVVSATPSVNVSITVC